MQDDEVRVRHMIEAAESACGFCEGMDFTVFCADERTWRAVVQCIEVIGEAGRHITEPTRVELPGVPWNQIVGMRHRMAHAYYQINLKLVWQVVEKDLEPLLTILRAWEAERGGGDP